MSIPESQPQCLGQLLYFRIFVHRIIFRFGAYISRTDIACTLGSSRRQRRARRTDTPCTDLACRGLRPGVGIGIAGDCASVVAVKTLAPLRCVFPVTIRSNDISEAIPQLVGDPSAMLRATH
jgi:hypothetical protein